MRSSNSMAYETSRAEENMNLSEYPLWHPNTDMDYFMEHGVTIVEGEGAVVRDQCGKEYLSATSGLWNAICGFSNSDIMDAVDRQMRTLPYGTLFRFGNEPALQLARKLVELTPDGLERCFFTSSGSSAVEVALKAARGYFHVTGEPQRQLVISLSESYHGTLCGSMSVSGENIDQEKFGLDLERTRTIPTPDYEGNDQYGEACISRLRELIEQEGEQVAAVIVEPVLGSAGAIVPPQPFFDELASICKQEGILLIADEVATGFGRTGRTFACEHFGLEPDIMTLSKGINSGYLPLGATLFGEEIFEAFRKNHTILTGETQAGNPVCCAAALATINVLERDRLVENAEQVGKRFKASLDQLLDHRCVANVRGVGLMLSVDLVKDKRLSVEVSPADVLLVVELLRREGLLVHPAPRGVSLFPPLVLSEGEADEIAEILDHVLSRLYFD